MKHFYIRYRETIDFRNMRITLGKSWMAAPLQFGPWLYQIAFADTAEQQARELNAFIKQFNQAQEWRQGRGQSLRIKLEASIVAHPPYEWLKQQILDTEEILVKTQKDLEFYRHEAMLARLTQEE